MSGVWYLSGQRGASHWEQNKSKINFCHPGFTEQRKNTMKSIYLTRTSKCDNNQMHKYLNKILSLNFLCFGLREQNSKEAQNKDIIPPHANCPKSKCVFLQLCHGIVAGQPSYKISFKSFGGKTSLTITTEIEADPGEQTNLDLENHSATSTHSKSTQKEFAQKGTQKSAQKFKFAQKSTQSLAGPSLPAHCQNTN